ncbi:MAG: VRR-NUC domain-containing protein [Oscillospiraceae bacterium]|nr:VRR-NUC domain-containing protein [Oscillospiraceae bacterium]
MRSNEAVEQTHLMEWTEYIAGRYPEIRLLFHVPNGGSRNKIEAANLKKQGVKAGVPDLFLPVARGGHFGLFIEMKSGKNRTTAQQKEWIEALKLQGYRCEVCYGWEAASEVLLDYLGKGRTVTP